MEELHRRKAASDARASKWSNTLTSQREAKLRMQSERDHKKELRMQEIDRAEATLRETTRREQIQRAQKMLFDYSDRVRSLHAKVLLSDVLAEREMQIAQRDTMRTLRANADAQFMATQRAQLAEAEAAELRKLEEEKDRLLATRDDQMRQLQAVKDKIRAEQKLTEREGIMMKEKAIAEAEAMVALEAKRAQAARIATMEQKMANNALREFKRQEQQRERDLEASIADYARRKDELDAKRLQKEREFTAEKVAMREKMAATMERIYLQAHKDQETRLARDVAEAEEKADAYEAKQAALRAERIAEEKRSSEAQMAAKAAAAEKRRQDRELYSERLKKKLQELKEEEEAEQAAIAARNRKHQGYLKHQMEVKAKRKSRQAEEAQVEALLQKLAMEDDEKMLEEYTANLVTDLTMRGRSITPITTMLGKANGVEKWGTTKRVRG